MGKIVAAYPGSFDPVTNGHVDIIKRGCRLFDTVIAAVVENPNKEALFTPEERLDMLRNSFNDFPNVEFDSFSGLLVKYAEKVGAAVVVRGIRAITDFEYEMQLALMNRRLNRKFETVFMMPKEEHIYISSGLVKEIARLGGSVSGLVPPYVEERLKQRYRS
ncbi:MAG TPA: pantetheine-phosphate adenylyltransferase [Acidobacteriota bacterium]|nr:pantetheine-phosphate adenylyltransferase [Acidobacteriota bacterium]